MSSWLRVSGHASKVSMAGAALPAASLSYLVVFWALSERTPFRQGVFLFMTPVAMLLSVAPLILHPLVRCRVCGLRLLGSTAARQVAASHRREWIASIEACPLCGDDGSASVSSRNHWLASGKTLETQYWTLRRTILALLILVLIGGGGFYFGASYTVPTPAVP
jgi:hypothetical protein